MNVFENLIEELKDENLLEDAATGRGMDDASAVKVVAASVNGHDSYSNESDPPQDVNGSRDEKNANDADFFRKRAMEEVSSLQMVEHVLSGVEREHMKTPSGTHDDMDAKKALHKFLQVSADPSSPEHSEAGLKLRQETEKWNFALFERDQKISVANLRRFCEGSRPVLSSQALISLSRFYRNSLFSEDVRGKFDFVMTRLFSRDDEGQTRRLLFPMQEMIGHISTLYASWSSMALFSNAEDHAEVASAVKRFNDFGTEVESTASLDRLLNADFFSKVRLYKEELAELFYVPAVAAAAIECNLKIGNKYVQLVRAEKAGTDLESVENKYGLAYDEIVSDAAAKTLLLVELLKLAAEDAAPANQREEIKTKAAPAFQPIAKPAVAKKPKSASKISFDLFGVNKWLMVLGFMAVIASVGVYLWSEKAADEDSTTEVAAPLQIEDAEVNKHLRGVRSSDNTLYAIAQPTYDALSEQEQKTLLQRFFKLANDRNLQKVTLLNSKGRTIAFASKDRLDLFSQ
jgi:hypothetical protein